jgi:nicotinate-nucleotide--dimethylbenzimidazole phosphoribosyltransferase
VTATALPRTFDEVRDLLRTLPRPDLDARDRATVRNATLTKPPGSLGRLESLAVWHAGWRALAAVEHPQVVIFAGNHGIAARGVSAYPPEVTAQMVANFAAGGAAINQLARVAGARLDVRALHLERPTADFTTAPAMTEGETMEAFAAGWTALAPDADLLVPGEMGIGNTTSAAALAAATMGGGGAAWTGPGTGVAGDALAVKIAVVDAGLALHRAAVADPLTALACLGGREVAAMAGAILAARMVRVPVILDGFICTAAAAVLHAAAPDALDHCVAGHVSAEPAHAALLERLGLTSLLSLDMRLGEGSGGALAIGVLRAALACHAGMATFAEAGVAGG